MMSSHSWQAKFRSTFSLSFNQPPFGVASNGPWTQSRKHSSPGSGVNISCRRITREQSLLWRTGTSCQPSSGACWKNLNRRVPSPRGHVLLTWNTKRSENPTVFRLQPSRVGYWCHKLDLRASLMKEPIVACWYDFSRCQGLVVQLTCSLVFSTYFKISDSREHGGNNRGE
jgi:hypothetical protein